MASARLVGTNENISTFGNGTRDYTSVATWNAATDNDLVTGTVSEILECYTDDSPYSQSISISGATTNALYLRIIRPAPGAAHNGVFGAGVKFTEASAAICARLNEPYCQIQDVELALTGAAGNRDVLRLDNDETAGIGIICNEAVEDFIVWASGASDVGYAVDCIGVDAPGSTYRDATSGETYCYNCISINASDRGFTGITAAKNSIAQDSGTVDFQTTTTTTCVSKDATGDIQSTLTFENAAGDDYRLATSDSAAMGTGTDLSGDTNYPFDDDIRFSTFGANWDIGPFKSNVVAVSGSPSIYSLSSSSASHLIRNLTAQPQLQTLGSASSYLIREAFGSANVNMLANNLDAHLIRTLLGNPDIVFAPNDEYSLLKITFLNAIINMITTESSANLHIIREVYGNADIQTIGLGTIIGYTMGRIFRTQVVSLADK